MWIYVRVLVGAVGAPIGACVAAAASKIALEIRERRTASVAAVRVFIEQIRRTTPALNAVVATRFDEGGCAAAPATCARPPGLRGLAVVELTPACSARGSG